MIGYVIEYLAVVETEIQQIMDWYDQQQPGLGERFLDHFKTAIHHIQRYPLLHGVKNHNARFRHLDRFPYKIAFKIVDTRIIIFGVFHDIRSPQLIRRRLK